jgi:hypothetical protein
MQALKTSAHAGGVDGGNFGRIPLDATLNKI